MIYWLGSQLQRSPWLAVHILSLVQTDMQSETEMLSSPDWDGFNPAAEETATSKNELKDAKELQEAEGTRRVSW